MSAISPVSSTRKAARNWKIMPARVEQGTGAQLAFVTINSLEGQPIEDVTIDIFKAWGVGQKKKDNGAMVLLAIADRKIALEVGGGLGGAIPDGMAGRCSMIWRPALRQGQYGAGTDHRGRAPG